MPDTGHRVALEPGLFPWLEGAPQWNQCLCNVRVIGSISSTSNDQFWHRFLLRERIFLFGRVCWSCKEQCCHSCYCHSFELGIGHMVGRERCELLKYHKLLQPHFPRGLEHICPLMLVTTLLVSASLYPMGPWSIWELVFVIYI